MNLKNSRAILAVLAFALLTVVATAQDNPTSQETLADAYTEIIGTGVSIRLPKGAARQANTDVYTIPEWGAAIVVMRLSGTPDSHIRDIASEQAEKSREITSKEEFRIGDTKAVLFVGRRQHELGFWQHTQTLITGKGDQSVVVSAQSKDGRIQSTHSAIALDQDR